MLILKEASVSETSGISLRYQAEHQKPGRQGNVLEVAVVVNQAAGQKKFRGKVNFEKCDGGTVDETLDRLADWCERTAKAIRNRGPANTVATQYSSPVRESDYETIALERAVLRAYETGALSRELLDALMEPYKGCSPLLLSKGDAEKSKDGLTFVDVVVKLTRPAVFEELIAQRTAEDHEAGATCWNAFEEVMRSEFGWR
jgi:hypothetical protein